MAGADITVAFQLAQGPARVGNGSLQRNASDGADGENKGRGKSANYEFVPLP